MLIVCGFISLWHMPLFFLLAGWATHASLQRRGRAGYVRERISKLFIPLIAGVILFGPAIKFLELRSGLDLSHTGLRVAPALQESFRVVIPSGLDIAPPFNETFLEFLPTFFTSLDRFSWSHLWFVAYLFTFSLVFVPFLPWLAPSGSEPHHGKNVARLPPDRTACPHPANASRALAGYSEPLQRLGERRVLHRLLSRRVCRGRAATARTRRPWRRQARAADRTCRNGRPSPRRAQSVHRNMGRARGLRDRRMVSEHRDHQPRRALTEDVGTSAALPARLRISGLHPSSSGDRRARLLPHSAPAWRPRKVSARPLCRCLVGAHALSLRRAPVGTRRLSLRGTSSCHSIKSRGTRGRGAARPLGSHDPERSWEQPSVDDTTARTLVCRRGIGAS